MYGKIFWVEFQWYPLKFHTKYLTQELLDLRIISIFETLPKSLNSFEEWALVLDLRMSYIALTFKDTAPGSSPSNGH